MVLAVSLVLMKFLHALQVVVFSEGELSLNECDFSACSATELVYAAPGAPTMIRNAVLGSSNCEGPHIFCLSFTSVVEVPAGWVLAKAYALIDFRRSSPK